MLPHHLIKINHNDTLLAPINVIFYLNKLLLDVVCDRYLQKQWMENHGASKHIVMSQRHLLTNFFNIFFIWKNLGIFFQFFLEYSFYYDVNVCFKKFLTMFYFEIFSKSCSSVFLLKNITFQKKLNIFHCLNWFQNFKNVNQNIKNKIVLKKFHL
jgi:hypothetical protein